MTKHALLSPSSAARWLTCPGSVALCAGLPDDSSRYADEGTDAHELAALCLIGDTDAKDYIGREMGCGNVVDADMASHVQTYLDVIRALVQTTGGELLIEQRLPISHLTGEEGAHGTADAVILAGHDLIVCDLKFGRGVVVDAKDNPQLQIYALAALEEFSLVSDFDTVRMIISQPRLSALSEWSQSTNELCAFGEKVTAAAGAARNLAEGLACGDGGAIADLPGMLAPSTKACQFCKARATCPAQVEHVASTVADDFVDLTAPMAPQLAEANTRLATSDDAHLGNCLAAVDLIEGWCKAVRAEVESRLLAGKAIPGFKLVEGRAGARKWADAAAAEEALKAMRLKHDQMYDYSVISPTSAEKLHKAGDIGPRQWPKLQPLITRADGKPSVAPESDKRPALAVAAVADDFEDLT
jgi:hypothetical protein